MTLVHTIPGTARTAARAKVRARINALGSRIAAINQQLRDEMRRPWPDSLRLSHLKRMRVRLKDQIRAAWLRRREERRMQAAGRSAAV